MIYLFNTNIVPSAAIVRVTEITEMQAGQFLQGQSFTSAIGHESTAQAFGQIIGQNVPVNRIFADPKPGDVAISLKLNGRLPEGQILSIEQLNEVGYSFFKMEFFDTELFEKIAYAASDIGNTHGGISADSAKRLCYTV